MNRLLHGVVRAIAETFDLPGPILEVGSRQVAGQEAYADLRSLFPDRDYQGLDMEAGPGVDIVGDVQALPLADQSVGTVLALSLFEHVPCFWRGFAEVRRVLRPDGALLVTCPFYLHVHGFPSDYWRFTPAALEYLLQDYPSRIVGWHGPRRKPINVWALAFGEKRPAISATQFAAYQERLARHARQPLGLGRRWRYGLGRLLCGRRPFAPFLDQEKWESVWRTPMAS